VDRSLGYCSPVTMGRRMFGPLFGAGLRSGLFDLGVVVVALVLAVLSADQTGFFGLGDGALIAVALLWRRRWPAAVFAVVAVLCFVQVPVGPQASSAALFVAMYSVVKYARSLLWGWLAGAVTLAGAVLAGLTGSEVEVVPIVGMATAAIWLTALALRTRRLYVLSLEERAATAERERDHLARIAVVEERARIARELHDVVAHSLAVMIAQADGGMYAFDRHPDRARGALQTVGVVGREALTEMRRLLGVLRDGDAGPTRPDGAAVERPRRALDQLAPLVARSRAAGLAVRAEIDATVSALPAGVELAVYRIVQEALTNALKHGGPGASAALGVRYAHDAVEVIVRSRGTRPAVARPGGHGLVGMRERVAMYGGAFRAGPRLDGDWEVHARIPVPALTQAPVPAQAPAQAQAPVPAQAPAQAPAKAPAPAQAPVPAQPRAPAPAPNLREGV
jgi:signal transduction histidine kinase